MPKQVFVIGIGGTGMRCLESFVHLCAMGMFDDTNVHMLALDTDHENGNFTRLKNLKDAYLNTKGVNKTHTALKDTFFSANLEYFEFSPNYEDAPTFNTIFDYQTTKNKKSNEAALIADLLFTGEVKEFDLRHGYRAQTHLGSMLMYHSIIDEIIENKESDLRKFIEEIINASANPEKPRVFILGSVFGGTGASSIPIIPKAFKKAASIISPAANIQENAFFGSTILTSYFSFKLPDNAEKEAQKIIASSDLFALNSQAAMMFYEADDTVRQTYQKFYLMGTDTIKFKSTKKDFEDQTVTGGKNQENSSHYIELLAAFAAYDFFNLEELELQQAKKGKKLDYVYRTFDEKGKIDFIDFVSSLKKKEFAKKFGLFIVLSFLTNLKKYDLFTFAQEGGLKKLKIDGYEDILPTEVKNLIIYMALFHFSEDEGNLKDGWLRQLHKSAGGGDKFLFKTDLFSSESIGEYEKFEFNNKIYQEDGDFKAHKFRAGILGIGTIYDKFFSAFVDSPEPDITNKCEKLIKRTYDTLCKLYKF
jgi:hypothetical protein